MTACAVAFERGVDDGGASFWLFLDAREALLQDLRGRQLLSGFWLAVWAQTESLLSLPIVALVRSLDCYLTTAFCQNFSCFFIWMMQIIIISFATSFLHCLRFRTPYQSTAQ